MNLVNISKGMFNNGVFVFDNGNYIFIEEIQYSSDGSYWEDTFNPSPHVDPRDPTNMLDGHKYRRVRHAGDDFFQLPEYIVAEDGKTPLFRVNNNELQYKYEDEDDTNWRTIVNMDTIKGDKGDKGDTGEGWHVDLVGYWLEKPDCSNVQVSTSTCTTCSGNTVAPRTVPALFLSLGDGLYEIDNADIGRYRSDNGTDWIEIVATDVGNLTRWIADDAVGTGAVDYHTQDTLGTRGKVYYCDEGRWQLFLNVAVAQHKVAPNEAYYTASQDGFFMDSYVESPLNSNPIYDTIAMTQDYKLVVKLNSIEPAHFKDGSFGDGLDEGGLNTDNLRTSPIKVNADDFSGFGLSTYIGGDGNTDMQVDTRELVGDGLSTYDDNGNNVDGEDRFLFIANVQDLIETGSGLEVVTGSDGFDNIQVLAGNGIEIDNSGTNVKVDDLSIAFDTNQAVSIKEYSIGTNDGVLASHLNPTVANENKGLLVNNSTGIEILLSDDNPALGFDGGSNPGLKVLEEGIRGWHLNADVVDENAGMTFDTVNDKIQAKVVAGGGLEIVAGGIQIDTTDLSWLDSDVVRSIQIGTDDLSGNLSMIGGGDTYVSVDIAHTGNVIEVTANTDVTELTNLITSVASSLPGSAHTHNISEINGLQAELDSKVEFGVNFDNILLTANGLFIRNASNNAWGKLITVDDMFNLGVDANVTP